MSLVPQHVAIIMDGNGRWATSRNLPRISGHKAGLEAVKNTIVASQKSQIKYLSLFAFSSENWNRPAVEVNALFELFLEALGSELNELHSNNIRLRFVGDLTKFSQQLQTKIQLAEKLTQDNTGLCLVLAVNYGGRWEIVSAVKTIAQRSRDGELDVAVIDEATLAQHLNSHDIPEPDLLIRTSGEQRISNFYLWQLAYTELFFTDVLWPDFDEATLQQALAFYASRDRRFGLIETTVIDDGHHPL